jgi:hypothetical protein
MAVGQGHRRFTLRPSGVGFLAAVIVLGLVYLPGLLSLVQGPARVADPVFPSTIARYSWYTGMLSADPFEAASLLYQNGVGVEFMDTPQSVLLSTDGSTYRRLDEAESLSIPQDQGDPAVSLLSADGTFVVVASAGRTGEVQVVTLRDGRRRTVLVGDERTALPVSISSDGRTVLLTTSDEVVDRYTDNEDLGLARLDLQTGQVLDYPQVRGVRSAAQSPDGSRIVVTSVRGVELVDATTGRVTATVDGSAEMTLDGDAWSADGRLVALAERSALVIVDVSQSTVLVHGSTNGSRNTSELYWVDATTGEQESFASYTPNFTGASLLRADAARDLVPRWRVTDKLADRGPLPFPLGILLAAVAGLGATGVASAFGRGPRRSSLGRKPPDPVRPAS